MQVSIETGSGSGSQSLGCSGITTGSGVGVLTGSGGNSAVSKLV